MDEYVLHRRPEDWDVRPIGTCCSMVSDSCDPSDANGRPYLGLEHLASGFPAVVGIGDPTQVVSAKTVFRRRDVLYGKLRPYLRKAVLAPFDGICSTDIIVIRPNGSMLPEFLTYLVHSDPFVDRAKATTSGVNHPRTSWSKLRPFVVPVPPVPEQRKIAAVLSLVQRAIEQQERLIALVTELKKALMHKLFTEGTRGEPQKQTAIGPIPQSWDVVALGDASGSFQYGTSVKCDYRRDGFPVLRIPNVVGGHVDLHDLKYGQPKTNEIEALKLRHGDLLFVRTNGVQENAGRCSMYRGELGDTCYFASYLIRVRVCPDQLVPEFIDEYSRTQAGVSFLSGRAVRTADGKFNINRGTIQRMLVPKPEIDEQAEIAGAAATLDSKLQGHCSKRDHLQALFRTLLHQLMTAQIRVNDLDLPELGLESADAELEEVV